MWLVFSTVTGVSSRKCSRRVGIEWSGVVRPVEIILSGDEEPAIGMGLLRNTRVLLDGVNNTVTVAFPSESIGNV